MADQQRREELTPEQEAKMPEYVKKWIQIGINTDRFTQERCEEIIHKVQTRLLAGTLGGKATPVLIFDNPVEAWIACNYAANGYEIDQLKQCVEDHAAGKRPKFKLQPFVTPYLNGSFSVSVFAFYDFFRDELGVKFESEEINELYEIWKSTTELGLIYNLKDVKGTKEDVCIVSQKPSIVKLNENNVVHCDGGPAIAYAGHFNIKMYALNGVPVPEWLAVTHHAQIPVERIHEIQNADVKTEFVRKIGVERMLSMGKKIDTFENYNEEWWTKSQYELWDMHSLFQGVPYAPHLKMLNQTTGVWHVEAVDPNCRTIPDALRFRTDGIDIDLQGIA